MDLSKISLGNKIIGGTSIVLVLSLLAFPWHSVDIPFGGSVSIKAIESPNAFWGVLGLLLTIAIIAVTAVQIFSPDTTLPELPVTWPKAVFFAAIAVLAVLVIKLIAETNSLGFGSYLSILLAGGMTYGAFEASKDGGSPTTGGGA